MERLFNASVRLIYEDEHGEQFVSSAIADRGEFGGTSASPTSQYFLIAKFVSVKTFSTRSLHHPVPLDMNTLTALKRCSLGLDLYLWLTYRTFALKRPLRITWKHLYGQFGANPVNATNKNTVQMFRRKASAS